MRARYICQGKPALGARGGPLASAPPHAAGGAGAARGCVFCAPLVQKGAAAMVWKHEMLNQTGPHHRGVSHSTGRVILIQCIRALHTSSGGYLNPEKTLLASFPCQCVSLSSFMGPRTVPEVILDSKKGIRMVYCVVIQYIPAGIKLSLPELANNTVIRNNTNRDSVLSR